MNNEAFRRKSLITVLSVMMVWTMTGCGSGTVKGDDLSAEAPAQSNETAAAQEDQAFEPFIRIDRDDPKASERDLENLRIITKGEYQLSKPKDKYGIDPDIPVNETGLDALNVSASAQFFIFSQRSCVISHREKRYIFLISGGKAMRFWTAFRSPCMRTITGPTSDSRRNRSK